MTERERFESWARQRWVHHEDFDQRIKAPSKYNNYEVQAAWDAWQERAAQPAPSVLDAIIKAAMEAQREGCAEVVLQAAHKAAGYNNLRDYELLRELSIAVAKAPEAKP